MKITFLLLKRGDKSPDECDALLRLLRTAHEELVLPMFLELGGLLAKRTTNTLTKLQLCSGPRRVKIGEAFSTKVFHLREEFLKVSDAAGELFCRGGFGPQAGLF